MISTLTMLLVLQQTLSPYVTSTTGPLNLFVDNGSTAASDGNSCNSAAAPCKTIQGACNKIPRYPRHPVDVSLIGHGGGINAYHAGCELDSIQLAPIDPTKGANVRFHGSYINATLGTGTPTGTSTGANANGGTPATFATLNDTGNAWTVSGLKNLFLRITSGTGAGQVRVIFDNTATQIKCRQPWGTVPDATSGYAVQTTNTVIDDTPGLKMSTNPQTGIPIYTVPVTTAAVQGTFYFNGLRGAVSASASTTGSANYSVEGVQFNTTNVAIRIQDSERIAIELNRFTGTNFQVSINASTEVSVIGNFAANSVSKALVFSEGGTAGTVTRSLTIRGNFVSGGYLADLNGTQFGIGDNFVDATASNATGIVTTEGVGFPRNSIFNELYAGNLTGPCVQVQSNASGTVSGIGSGFLLFQNSEFDACQNGVVIASTQTGCINTMTASTGLIGFGWLLKRGTQLERPDLCAPVAGSLGIYTFDGVNALPDLPGVGSGTTDYYCRADTNTCMLSHSTAKHF